MVEKNSSIGQTYKKYVGITDFSLVKNGINPTKAELSELGVDVDQEPIYWNEEKQTMQVALWLTRDNPNILTKKTFFFSREWESSKTPGSFLHIDKFGRTKWYDPNVEQIENEYFDLSSSRKCFGNGEAFMFGSKELGFVRALLNVKKKKTGELSECRLDNPEAIINSQNISELKELLTSEPNNRVIAALGVKNEKFYDVFNGFLPSWVPDTSRLAEAVKKSVDGGFAKAYFGEHPYKLTAYTPTPVGAEADNKSAEVNLDLPF